MESPSGSILSGWSGWLPEPVARGLGRLADLLGIAAVVFGVAGALANSIILLGVGVEGLTGARLPTQPLYLGLLALLAAAFMTSAATGIDRGIRILSSLNLLIALVLLGVLWASSEPAAMSAIGLDALAVWIAELPRWSFSLIEVDAGRAWADGWTLTYLIWWIAWTPFVGLFIARISRGRTLRTFLLGVIGVPTLFSMAWFAVLGGGALAFDQTHQGMLSNALGEHYTRPLFLWLEHLPHGTLLAWTCCLLLFVFMITSADSAAYVLGMLSSGTPQPTLSHKLGWGAILTLLTAGLLVRDDVDVNKAVAIIGALPFAVFLALQAVGLIRAVLVSER
jgi:glycine betaine transporter